MPCSELIVDSGDSGWNFGTDIMMPRAASTVADAKNPSSASSQRPRIGFSIDFLVGNGKNNNNPAASTDARSQDSADESGGKKNSDGKDSPPMVSSSPDCSSPSTSPPIGIPTGSSPLFQTWNPSAGSAPPGNFPPSSSYLEMATLANLRNLYGQTDASGRPAGFFGGQQPQHPHANNASAAAGLSPLFAMHGAGPGHLPVFGGGGGVGGGAVGGRPADALAQQWWLLAQARQQQQRIFAAAAAASHRFAPGHFYHHSSHSFRRTASILMLLLSFFFSRLSVRFYQYLSSVG